MTRWSVRGAQRRSALTLLLVVVAAVVGMLLVAAPAAHAHTVGVAKPASARAAALTAHQRITATLAASRLPVPAVPAEVIAGRCPATQLERYAGGCAYPHAAYIGVRGAALHEYAHLIDYHVLPRAVRTRFARLMDIPVWDIWTGENGSGWDGRGRLRVIPGPEVFADVYAACARWGVRWPWRDLKAFETGYGVRLPRRTWNAACGLLQRGLAGLPRYEEPAR